MYPATASTNSKIVHLVPETTSTVCKHLLQRTEFLEFKIASWFFAYVNRLVCATSKGIPMTKLWKLSNSIPIIPTPVSRRQTTVAVVHKKLCVQRIVLNQNTNDVLNPWPTVRIDGYLNLGSLERSIVKEILNHSGLWATFQFIFEPLNLIFVLTPMWKRSASHPNASLAAAAVVHFNFLTSRCWEGSRTMMWVRLPKVWRLHSWATAGEHADCIGILSQHWSHP